MNNLWFLVYGILFLIISLYLFIKKSKWSILTTIIGIILILLYIFLRTSSPTSSGSGSGSGSGSDSKKEKAVTAKGFVVKETIQSPVLKNTFNYIAKDKRIEYAGDRNINNWGIKTKDFTHIRFPNKKIFKLDSPGTGDSRGVFINDKGTENFFSDYIEVGTFS